MRSSLCGRLLPTVLQKVNRAAERVRPEGDAALALSQARDAIADVAGRRIQIENRIRCIQASASRGRGMTRAALDAALEQVVADLRNL